MTEIKVAAHRTQMNTNHNIVIKDYLVVYFNYTAMFEAPCCKTLKWGSKVLLRDIQSACKHKVQ